MGALKRIWYMNLSNNNLSGEIPIEIYKLIEKNNLPYDAILSKNNFSFIVE